MRIALTITELYPGGAERCLVNLACFLKHRGHEVQVWQLWPPPPAAKRQLIDILDESGIPWHSAGARAAWQFPAALFWLRKELGQFAPDVVQSFLFHANVATSLALRSSNTPFFGGARVRQPQRSRRWLQRFATRRMQKLVCVSQSVAWHCQRVEGIPDAKLLVIPNGIALQRTSMGVRNWSELGLPPMAKTILFVGRLDEQKGVDRLLSRADQFLKQLPEHHLVLMGEGPLRTSLEHSAENLECRARVHLVGWQAAPLEWMSIADCLLLPARYEGMPNVILEAMSIEVPVVSFDVEGVRELLGEDETANLQIVSNQDFDLFSAAIVRLATSVELRRSCGQYNRLRIEQHFQLDEQLLRYEELYLRANHYL